MGIIVVSGILLLIIALIVAIIAIYISIYTHKINKKISGEDTYRKKMWTPLKFCIVTVITTLFLLAILGVIITKASGSSLSDKYLNAQYNCEAYSPDEMSEGYMSKFSIDENIGYSKTVEEIEDVRYTYFISEEPYDGCHPAFLIYAQYIGENSIRYFDYECDFSTFENDYICGTSMSEGKAEEYLCIVGTASVDCDFSCVVEFYEEQKEEMNFETLRENNTPLDIYVFAN